jgi:hypothetical protein
MRDKVAGMDVAGRTLSGAAAALKCFEVMAADDVGNAWTLDSRLCE